MARNREVEGASATQHGHGRDWRNTCTMSAHDPTFPRAPATGALLVDDTPRPQNGFI